MTVESYKTISGQSEGLYKEKGSKFIAKAYHVESEDECKQVLSDIKKEYNDGAHHSILS